MILDEFLKRGPRDHTPVNISYLVIAVAHGVGGGLVGKVGSLLPLAFMDLVADMVISRAASWKAQDHVFM